MPNYQLIRTVRLHEDNRHHRKDSQQIFLCFQVSENQKWMTMDKLKEKQEKILL